MRYTTPELLSIGSATTLVLANESSPNLCVGPDNAGKPWSYVDELW
jgi:hypothetical protein